MACLSSIESSLGDCCWVVALISSSSLLCTYLALLVSLSFDLQVSIDTGSGGFFGFLVLQVLHFNPRGGSEAHEWWCFPFLFAGLEDELGWGSWALLSSWVSVVQSIVGSWFRLCPSPDLRAVLERACVCSSKRWQLVLAAGWINFLWVFCVLVP